MALREEIEVRFGEVERLWDDDLSPGENFFRVLFPNKTGILFRVPTTQNLFILEFLQSLDEDATVWVVEKYLRSQGFCKVSDEK